MSWTPWAVVWPEPVGSELDRLARRDRRLVIRIRQAINRYADTGHGNVRKLQGADEYRLRVGDWRVRFALDHAARVIVVVRVSPRRDAYRS